MTLEEVRRLQAAEPELALTTGAACECDDPGWIIVGTGHLIGCANRLRFDTRRRMTPNQVVEELLEVMP